MQSFRQYRYRLDPTPDQEEAFRQWSGCARAVWNAALEQRRFAWRVLGQTVRWHAQDAELSEAKKALPWLREPHSDVLQQAIRDLDRAFEAFFDGRSGYPRFRARCRRNERFRIQDRGDKGPILVRRTGQRSGKIRIPKLGWVRLRWSRAPIGRVSSVTVSRDALGWHAALCCEQRVEAPPRVESPVVGVDRGVVATVATSDGELRTCRGLSPGEEQRLRRLRRKAGRQETVRRAAPPTARGRSRRHQRTLDQIARLEARSARIGRDFRHKVSTDLARKNGTVVVEKLDVIALTRSARGTASSPGRRVHARLL